jgi:hypothetical protein
MAKISVQTVLVAMSVTVLDFRESLENILALRLFARDQHDS